MPLVPRLSSRFSHRHVRVRLGAAVSAGVCVVLVLVCGWADPPRLFAQRGPGQAVESLEQLLSSLDEELGWDAGALFPPDAGGVDGLSLSNRRSYADAACAALTAGLRKDRGPSASELSQAREHLRKARLLCTDDPRLTYSAGLIALAGSDWSTACEELDAAADQTELPHPGAVAGLVYAHLAEANLQAAAASAHDLAELLADQDADWPGPALSRALAEWLGRAVACAGPGTATSGDSTPGTTRSNAERPESPRSVGAGAGKRSPVDVTAAGDGSLREEIVAVLPAGLHGEFERGFTAVAQRRARLLQWAGLTAEQLRTETADSRAKIEQQLQQLQQAEQKLIDRRRQLEGPHAEAVQELTQRMRQQATRLQAEAAESQRITAQIDRLNNSGNKGDKASQRGAPRGRRGAGGRSNRNQRGNSGNNAAANDRDRQQKIKELREKLKDNNDQLARLKREVEKLRDERRDLDAGHADELKEVKRELDAARRRRQQSEEELADLKAALSNPAELKKRANSPATWLPLNLEDQRDALTRAFRQATAG